MTDFLELLPPYVQVLVWGAAWSGDVTEVAALVAERRPGQWHRDGLWDRTARDLVNVELWHEDERQLVPEWWALPAVTDYVIAIEVAS